MNGWWNRLERLNNIAHKALVIVTTIYVAVTGVIELSHKLEIPYLTKILEDHIADVLFWCLLVSLVFNLITLVLFTHASQFREHSKELERWRKSVRPFRALAHRNAYCDKELFQCLFLDLNSGKHDKETATELGKAICVKNIEDNLNSACDILGAITDDRCCACIQVLEPAHRIACRL